MTFDGAEEEWGDRQTEDVIGCCLRWADLQVRYGRGDNIQQALWSPLTPTGTRILRLTGSSMPRPQLCPGPPTLVYAPLHLFIPHYDPPNISPSLKHSPCPFYTCFKLFCSTKLPTSGQKSFSSNISLFSLICISTVWITINCVF